MRFFSIKNGLLSGKRLTRKRNNKIFNDLLSQVESEYIDTDTALAALTVGSLYKYYNSIPNNQNIQY